MVKEAPEQLESTSKKDEEAMTCHKPAFENNKMQKFNFGNASDERVQEEEDSVSSKHSSKPELRKPAAGAGLRVSMTQGAEN